MSTAARDSQSHAQRPRHCGWALLLMAAPVLGACDATEGQLLLRAADDAAPAGADAGQRPGLRANMSLQYQITGELDTTVAADVFVIDLFNSRAEQLSELHAAGRIVVAYVSAGSLETWRDDVGNFPRSAVGQTLADYPDENWLDTRDASVRRAMQARFDRAVNQGFDGIFASTIGAYLLRSGFALTRDDELDYARFLADTAHARGLNIGLSGDFELAAQLHSHFDWALTTDCIADNTCAELTPLLAAGLPVFDMETAGDHDTVCAQAASYGITVSFKRASFDAQRSVCP
jgi:hypothetical protein